MNKKLIQAIYEISDKNKKHILKSFGIKLGRKKITKKFNEFQEADAVIDYYENKYDEILSESSSPFLPILFHTYLYNILEELENQDEDHTDIDFIVNTLQSLNIAETVKNGTCFPLFIELLEKILEVSKKLDCSNPDIFLEPYDINLSIYLNSYIFYLNNLDYRNEDLDLLIDLFIRYVNQFDNQNLLLQLYLFLLELLAEYEQYKQSIDLFNDFFSQEFSKNILVADCIMNIAIRKNDEKLAHIVYSYVTHKQFFIIETQEDRLIAQDIIEEYENYKNKETLSIPYFMSPKFNKD